MASSPSAMIIILLLIFPFAIFLVKHQNQNQPKQPPELSERIPFVSNAWQFMTNKRLFITRAKRLLKTSPIVKCRLGPLNLYLVGGHSSVSAIFRSSFTSEPWIFRILEHTAKYVPSDLAKFIKDESGGATLPRNMNTDLPVPEKRIWHAMHRTHEEFLVSARSVNAFAASFQTFYSQQLAIYPVGEWVEDVRVLDFLRQNMAAAATRSVLGPKIIDVNPGFIDAFWNYEKFAETLAFGLPSWLNQRAVRARERFRAMCGKWYALADQEFDWDIAGSQQDPDWEPIFGSQISRGLARWAKSFDFSADSMGAVYILLLFGLHANTIPICTWIVMELMKNPNLLQAIKEEVSQAEISDGHSARTLDYKRLVSLPLLQSVYTEALRLHVSVLVTRTSIEPITIAGYHLPKGSIVQAPTEVAHLDEAVWGTSDHPASEFWGYRHIKEIEIRDDEGNITKRREFSVAARSGSFFPYGGGFSICAGRNFAKPEILLAVAMMISRFDMQYVEWLNPDGTSSKRAALNDTEYANSVATPPDREMKIRWRRIW